MREGTIRISSSWIVVSKAMGNSLRSFPALEGVCTMGWILRISFVPAVSAMEAVAWLLIKAFSAWDRRTLVLNWLCLLLHLNATAFFVCFDLIDSILCVFDSVSGKIDSAVDIDILQ